MIRIVKIKINECNRKQSKKSAIRRLCQFLFVFAVMIFISATLTACDQTDDSGISYIKATTAVEELSDVTIDKIVDNIVADMSLNEKVGQMFIVSLSDLGATKKSVKKKNLTTKMKKNMELYPVGGVVILSKDAVSSKQTQNLVSNLQKQSAISLFTCANEEGGTISYLSSNPKMHMTYIPPMLQLGMSGDKKTVRKAGETLGKELYNLGINVDFAPIGDCIPEGMTEEQMAEAEIGNRSFGSDSKQVAKMVKQMVKGLQSSNVCATLKHFPGQGYASSDTHISAANVDKTIEQFRSIDFLPFSSGIDAGAEFVMMSHESLNSVTGDSTPACMSSLIVKDILKEELGFKGIVMTDAMNMLPIVSQYSSDEAAVKCVQAGVDVIVMPQDLQSAYDGLITAVQQGKISEKRINSSVKKIIKCKIKKGIIALDSPIVVRASQQSYEKIGEMENNE